MKRYVIIAGVNGAGKTTFCSSESSFNTLAKINLDETVREVGNWKNPLDVVVAGKIVVAKIKEYLEHGVSFCQETTLCGRSIINCIKKASNLGYGIELYYVGVESPDIAKERVHYRVLHGGHGIPDDDIERRYYESLKNLGRVISICDSVYIYDNTEKFHRIAVYEKGKSVWNSSVIPEWYDIRKNIK